MQLSGKTAIVTGGARGLGATYVRALAASGGQVVVADVLEAEGDALLRDIREHQATKVMFIRTDVTKQADTIRLAERTVQRFGAIDILVNNAAMFGDLGTKKPFDQISEAEWDQVMSVNVKGIWQCVKAVFPFMQKQGSGKIINISSSTAYTGNPGFAHYVASKSAVIGLTRALARELGVHNICVNAIAPGLVSNEAATRLNPREEHFERARNQRAIRRLMAPEDLTGTVLFLASSDSDFVTGQTFVVDGGAIMP